VAAPDGQPAVSLGRGSRDTPSTRRVWTWVASAGALVGAATALGFGLAADRDYDQACDLLAGSERCGERTALVDPSSADQYRALRDSVDRKALTANICWGVAGGLAVTAVALFFLEGRGGSPRSARATPGIDAGPNGVSLTLQLRY